MDFELYDTDEYIEQLLSKIDELNKDLYKVKRANTKLKGENRHLRRVIGSLKKEQPKKQHYKNGKRGTMKNG